MYKAGDPFHPLFDDPPRTGAILSFEPAPARGRPAPAPADARTDGPSRIVSFAVMAERLRNRRRDRR